MRHSSSGRHKNRQYVATNDKTSKFMKETDRNKGWNRQIPFIIRARMSLNSYHLKQTKSWITFNFFSGVTFSKFSNTTVLVVHLPQQVSATRIVVPGTEGSSFMGSGWTLLGEAPFWEGGALPLSVMSLEGAVVDEIEIKIWLLIIWVSMCHFSLSLVFVF